MPEARDHLPPNGPDRGTGPDPAWDQALDWLLLTRGAPRDAALQARLAAWLAQAEAHRRAYDRAQRVWRLTAGLPRVASRTASAGARRFDPSPAAPGRPRPIS